MAARPILLPDCVPRSDEVVGAWVGVEPFYCFVGSGPFPYSLEAGRLGEEHVDVDHGCGQRVGYGGDISALPQKSGVGDMLRMLGSTFSYIYFIY